MITEDKIRDGLFCSVKNISNSKHDAISFLKKNDAAISLTCFFSADDCGLSLADDAASHKIEFTFHHHFLEQFSMDEKNIAQQFPAFQQHEICCNTKMILHEIVNCKLEGVFKNLFLESKAIALLLCFQKCNTAESQADCASCKFLTKDVEKEKILKAKEIILKQLHHPPTIPELSLQIGINQCYLKKGFKELFGSTVYEFVQEQRMLQAKMLLSTSDFSVSQVAEKIGFSSLSSFSAAFKKHTGVFPSELQLN